MGEVLEVVELSIVDVGVALVAPDGEVREAEGERVIARNAVE
jgi:hypothetical protein